MSLNQRIYLSPPDIGLSEEAAASRAVRSGWVAPLGPEVDAFESEIARFVGVHHAVALNSGTAGLHLGLRAVGVLPGDSVITSTMTFVATANAISYNGAHPVFVDSLSDGTLDPELVERAIKEERSSGRTVRAILPVDIYGRPADYSEIDRIAESFNLPIISDSAESLGSSRFGVRAGAWGEMAVLSFNGNKVLTTSGGGMLLTGDADKAQYVRYLASQARETVPHYEHLELGFNYRMSNVSAAIGRAQLARLPEMIERRRRRRRQYQEFFSNVDGVSMLPGDIAEDNCWLSSILIDTSVAGWTPLELRAHLEELNIEARPLWKPMHLQPLYRESRFVGGQVAERLFKTGLALPSGSAMLDSAMDRVLHAISSFLQSR